MKAKFKKHDGLLFLFAFIGVAVFLFLYPRLYPEAAIDIRLDKQEIIDTGTTLLEDLGYDLSQHHLRVSLSHDANQIEYLEKNYSPEKANLLIRDSIPVFYWELRWIHDDLPDDLEPSERHENEHLHLGSVRLIMDFQGFPVRFEYKEKEGEETESDSVAMLSRNEMFIKSEHLFQRLSGEDIDHWTYLEEKEKSSEKGSIHQFQWERIAPVAGESISIEIDFFHDRIRAFQKQYEIPEKNEQKDQDIFDMISFVLVYLVFIVLGVIFFIKRLRSDLLDLKSGLVPGIMVLIGWFLYFWMQTTGQPPWEMILGFVITVPFIAGGFWAIFVLGESFTRELWSEKLMTMDYLRRKFFFPELGVSILRGLCLILISLGLMAFLNYVLIRFSHGFFVLSETQTHLWSALWPSLVGIGLGLFNSFYTVVTFCLFFIPFLRRHIRRSWISIVLLIILWVFICFPVPCIMPFFLRMIVNACIGMIFTYFFFKYDFITVATGALGLPVFYSGITLLHTGSGFFSFHGWILLAILGFIVLWALISCRRESFVTEFAPYVPDYLHRIYEKERIQRELEIARNVQMTFLPRKNPKLEGLDIASLCLPAEEVGGDYYDFIEVSPTKLGVVVGDVSGKGISAAFYMTLTKGLLKAQAKHYTSPKEVLISVNDLFYENAERDIFISMIYGIIDLKTKTLTFSRAGHNPMILHRSSKEAIEEICPPGIALGLEAGDLFAKTIEERSIRIDKGDVLFFYTDGLNEAQNRFKEEFNEDRLKEAVNKYTSNPAEVILNRIRDDILRFIDDAPQHDDMTAVLIKVH